MEFVSGARTDAVLSALAEQLEALGAQIELVVIGGSGLLALGIISRPTRDVDVLAIRRGGALDVPDPLPPALLEARDRVAAD